MSATVVPCCSTLTGLPHAHQDRADRLGAAEPLHQLVADVAGGEVREDEHVGVALDARVRVVARGRSPRRPRCRGASRRRRSSAGPLLRARCRTAFATRSASGCRTEPKLENESIATRGSMSKTRAVSAARHAISASSSAVGSMLTIVSAKKNSRSLSTSRCSAETRDTPSRRPTSWMAGRIVSGYCRAEAADEAVGLAVPHHHQRRRSSGRGSAVSARPGVMPLARPQPSRAGRRSAARCGELRDVDDVVVVQLEAEAPTRVASITLAAARAARAARCRSSAIARAARMIVSSSPSGNTIRRGGCRLRLVHDQVHDLARRAHDPLERLAVRARGRRSACARRPSPSRPWPPPAPPTAARADRTASG